MGAEGTLPCERPPWVGGVDPPPDFPALALPAPYPHWADLNPASPLGVPPPRSELNPCPQPLPAKPHMTIAANGSYLSPRNQCPFRLHLGQPINQWYFCRRRTFLWSGFLFASQSRQRFAPAFLAASSPCLCFLCPGVCWLVSFFAPVVPHPLTCHRTRRARINVAVCRGHFFHVTRPFL